MLKIQVQDNLNLQLRVIIYGMEEGLLLIYDVILSLSHDYTAWTSDWIEGV